MNLTGVWREARSDSMAGSTLLVVHRPSMVDAQVVVASGAQTYMGRLYASGGKCSIFLIGIGSGWVEKDWIEWTGNLQDNAFVPDWNDTHSV